MNSTSHGFASLLFITAACAGHPGLALGQEQYEEEIVITGSRLSRSVEETTGPVSILERREIAHATQDSLARLLQTLPAQNGVTEHGSSNEAFGAGRVNLRGLGSERTLVLLNGRRFVFGGLGADSSVDIDAIPLGMIERVEVAASGASPIYGADAVAGVVNVITRRDFTGLELDAGYSESERGDGSRMFSHIVAGLPVSEGNVTFGIEYVDQDAVRQSARPYSRQVETLVTLDGPVVASGSIYGPDGAFDVPEGNVQGLERINAFYTRVAGSSTNAQSDFRVFDPTTDLFNYAPYAYLQTPSERASGWIVARRALTPTVEWFAEGLIYKRTSHQSFAPAAYSNFSAGAAPIDPEFGRQMIPANNYYNPFGVPVIGVFRRFVESGPITFNQDAKTYRAVTGLRANTGAWHWEGSIAWARSTTDELQTNLVLRNEVRNAVGPSGLDANGNVVCGTPDPATGVVAADDIISGCVPLNLFGGRGPTGRGTITPTQLANVLRDLRNQGSNTQWLVDLVTGGPFGQLPAGDIEWAVGGQFRRESGELRLDPAAGRGVTSGTQFGIPDDVSFDTREAFAEARFPLLRDRPLARAIDVSFGARYSSSDAFDATTTFSEGLHWAMTRHITVRGSYSDVFRIPSTLDLYARELNEITGIVDPCGLGPDPIQQQHCTANGVPGGSYEQDLAIGIPIVLGGNPQLRPEAGHSWTAGVLFNVPGALPMQASLDYWHVALGGALDRPNPQTLIESCADTGAVDACARIRRHADGTLDQVDARFANSSQLVHSGVDLAISTSTDSRLGRFAARLDSTYLIQARLRRFENATAIDRAGTFEFDSASSWPRVRGRLAIDWSQGAWNADYVAHYTDSLRECGDKTFFVFAYLDDTQCRRISSRLTHDIAAGYRFSSGLRVALMVENVTDSQPPRVNLSGSANTDPSIYALLGRYYSLRATYSGN